MRKSDKKLDKIITIALTDVCENTLKAYSGFEWITHEVDYHRYLDSLTIVCVFDTNANLATVLESDEAFSIKHSIEKVLHENGIVIKGIQRRILFDTEEACAAQHNGVWNERLLGISSVRH